MKDELTKTDTWDVENDIDLAGILLTISAIAKRLAKLVLDAAQQNNGGNR